MLKWSESDFLECLEVEPFFEDDDQSYEFNVRGEAIDLQVKILPQRDAIGIKTKSKKTGEYYTDNYYAVLGSITCENEVLIFDDCIPVGDSEFFNTRFYMKDIPSGYRVRVEVGIKPEIFVRTILK